MWVINPRYWIPQKPNYKRRNDVKPHVSWYGLSFQGGSGTAFFCLRFQKSYFHLDPPRQQKYLFPLLWLNLSLQSYTMCKNWTFFIKNKQEFSTITGNTIIILLCFSFGIKPGEDCYFLLADAALSTLLWWEVEWKKVDFKVPPDPSHSVILLRITELRHDIHSCLSPALLTLCLVFYKHGKLGGNVDNLMVQ